MSRVVVVGASVAGVNCALSLRSFGFRGKVCLVEEEQIDEPYDKPPLSKEFLTGRLDTEGISLLSESRAREADLTLLSGHSAVGLDLTERAVLVDNHAPFHYDKLVIATGSRARPSPWKSMSGIYSLRSLDDALAIRAELVSGRRLIVIGAGFIGAEVAATARGLGVKVTVVDPLSTPMARIFDPEVGNRFAQLHHRHGVEMLFGTGVDQMERDGGEIRVRLTTGRVLAADFVVVGIGSVPNDDWLRSSGIPLDDGILCDARGLVKGQSAVYAIGDVARWTHPRDGFATRLEHWTNALEQAACVANNIANPNSQRTHHPVEYVWSDQYDWRIQVAGRTDGSAAQTTITGPKADQFAVLFNDTEGNLRGGVTVNWSRAMVYCRKAIITGGSASDIEALLGNVSQRR